MYITCDERCDYCITHEVDEFDAVYKWVGLYEKERTYPQIGKCIPQYVNGLVLYQFQGFLLCTQGQPSTLRNLMNLGKGWFACIRFHPTDLRRFTELPELAHVYPRANMESVEKALSLDAIDEAPSYQEVLFQAPLNWKYLSIYFRKRRADKTYMVWKCLELPADVYRLLYPYGMPIVLNDHAEYKVVGFIPKPSSLFSLALEAAGGYSKIRDLMNLMCTGEETSKNFTRVVAHRPCPEIPVSSNNVVGIESLWLSVITTSREFPPTE